MPPLARQAETALWRLDNPSPEPDLRNATTSHWPPEPSLGRLLLLLAIVLALFLGGRGITSEGAVSTQGDMPRHLMNGVFLRDMLANPDVWRSGDVLGQAQRYFARYPALSIGHHPPLLPVALVPFYSVLGISIFSARIAILACFVLSIAALYSLTRRLYGTTVAGWTSLLLASNPFMILFGQRVMSEMLMIALVLVALDILLRFCDTGRPRDFALFIVIATASLCAKQLAIFMFPVYAIVLVTQARRAHILQAPIVGMIVGGGVIGLLVAALTLAFSPFNVEAVRHISTQARALMSPTFVWSILSPIVDAQLTTAMLACVPVAVAAAWGRRDRRIALGIVWVLTVTVSVIFVTASLEPERYSIVGVPGYALLVGSLAAASSSRRTRWLAAIPLIVAVCSQLWAARDVRPTGAEGYEAAAQFVLAQGDTPTVLYHASIDTGYFVFFTRKHDPDQRLVVLRSDKLFTTSLMSNLSAENRISSPDDIYTILQTFGTRFIVAEDRESHSPVLNWLLQELKTDRFVERLRIPIVTDDYRLRNVSLVVYEYLEATPPRPDAAIDMRIPVAGRAFEVPLSTLIAPGR